MPPIKENLGKFPVKRLHQIPANPVLTPAMFFHRSSSSLPEPLGRPNVWFFAYARAALFEGLKVLKIKEGDNVLLPSLICNVVLAPFNELSIEVRFYEVDARLKPVFESAAHQIDTRTKAFLAVDYFGFPQDLEEIRQFCRSYGLYFIEDNAQGFLSCVGDQPLGTFGDIGLISFRKTLPIPNGAVLIVNNPDLWSAGKPTPSGEGRSNLVVFVLSCFLRYFEMRTGVKVAAMVRRFVHVSMIDTSRDEEKDLTSHRVAYSPLSRWMLRHMNPESIRATRREGFLYWLDYFRNFQGLEVHPLFTELASGAVPFAFPVVTDSSSALIETFAQWDIECVPWPTLPRQSSLRNRAEKIVLVPVYQEIDPPRNV